MSTRDYCNGAGHKGGAKSYRVCPGCGIKKANTAFRAVGGRGGARKKGAAPLSGLCMKCMGGYELSHNMRGAQGSNVQHDYVHLAASRVPFAVWMRGIGATAADRGVVRRALARYGLKNPSAADILDAHTTEQRKWGQLFHATVLAAHEAKRVGVRELRKGNERVRPGEDSAKREAAA